ncbi:SMI1/KNR4 family protein [Nonomuraea sp. NBC_01738]|uniref:SMI1/KNR4 family protein n=1 Tax=Nonomuraea sp. NBC_01738 TaxID=2976003 RepID=UPI002E10A30E|nr:SMI1/KNR4 family protein [Nonomuraea sp. NBC_01738]
MHLDVIRRGLDALRAYDPEFALFGARTHRYRFGPPIEEAALVTIEARIGTRLPDDYRTFLSRLGNGGAGPYYGVHGVRQDAAWERFGPFPFTRAWEPPEDDDDEVMAAAFEGLLAVAEHGCGYRSHLVVAGRAAGQVWGDWTVVGEVLAPEAESFGAWYHDWLAASLREVLGNRIESAVHDGPGWSVDRRLLDHLPPPLPVDGDAPVRVLRLLKRAYRALYERRHDEARDLIAQARATGAPDGYQVRVTIAEAVLLREEGQGADALALVNDAIPRCGRPDDLARLHGLRATLS